jgi:hypothetical protein
MKTVEMMDFFTDYMDKFVRHFVSEGAFSLDNYKTLYREELKRRHLDGTFMTTEEKLHEDVRPFIDLMYYYQLAFQLHERMCAMEVSEDLWDDYHTCLVDIDRVLRLHCVSYLRTLIDRSV